MLSGRLGHRGRFVRQRVGTLKAEPASENANALKPEFARGIRCKFRRALLGLGLVRVSASTFS